MNETRTIHQLERDLHGSEDALSGPVLADIRARGRSRRRHRWAAYAAGSTAVVLAAGAVLGVATQRSGEARDRTPVADHPTTLTPLAKRALREIPGTVRLSEWQVLVPSPTQPVREYGDQKVPADHIEAGPVDIGARRYTGVTAYAPAAFPAWLWEGVKDYEQTVLGSEEGYPVGSLDTGIIVDAGPLDLACMRPLPEWGEDGGDGCFPAMLAEKNGSRTYAWGMGTDDFLDEGKDLELFSSPDYSAGVPRMVWIGGTDGTDVGTVTLVTTDGTQVEATVASGTLVPGETMFWATVDGELAQAITRDEDGKVLERHQVRPCSDPVDCEVR